VFTVGEFAWENFFSRRENPFSKGTFFLTLEGEEKGKGVPTLYNDEGKGRPTPTYPGEKKESLSESVKVPFFLRKALPPLRSPFPLCQEVPLFLRTSEKKKKGERTGFFKEKKG